MLGHKQALTNLKRWTPSPCVLQTQRSSSRNQQRKNIGEIHNYVKINTLLGNRTKKKSQGKQQNTEVNRKKTLNIKAYGMQLRQSQREMDSISVYIEKGEI